MTKLGELELPSLPQGIFSVAAQHQERPSTWPHHAGERAHELLQILYKVQHLVDGGEIDTGARNGRPPGDIHDLDFRSFSLQTEHCLGASAGQGFQTEKAYRLEMPGQQLQETAAVAADIENALHFGDRSIGAD